MLPLPPDSRGSGEKARRNLYGAPHCVRGSEMVIASSAEDKSVIILPGERVRTCGQEVMPAFPSGASLLKTSKGEGWGCSSRPHHRRPKHSREGWAIISLPGQMRPWTPVTAGR
eukprot:scaffold141548_cov14-Prasinocladus_malaysianus.AAC.1